MNEPVCVRFPVSRPFNTIVLPLPCIYCGRPLAPGAPPVIKEFPVTVRRRERDPQAGRMALNVVDEPGIIRLKLPYCAEHSPVPRPISLIQLPGLGLSVRQPCGMSSIPWPTGSSTTGWKPCALPSPPPSCCSIRSNSCLPHCLAPCRSAFIPACAISISPMGTGGFPW